MYQGDGFFTLGFGAQAGLVVIALALGVLMIVATHQAARAIRLRVWAVVSALALFWGFVWLSPQVFYAYFLLVIDDLPAQWVVGWPPPSGPALTDLILFSGPAMIGDHARGLLFWLMAATAFMASVEDEAEEAD